MSEPATNAVKALFLELLELPEHARAERLRERADGDDSLRRRVQQLLDADASNGAEEAF